MSANCIIAAVILHNICICHDDEWDMDDVNEEVKEDPIENEYIDNHENDREAEYKRLNLANLL